MLKGRSWMAKGKRGTALFDVIHATKKSPTLVPPSPKKSGGFSLFKLRAKDSESGSGSSWFSRKEKAEPIVEPPPRIIERIVEKPIYIEKPVEKIVEVPMMRIAGEKSVGVDKGSGEIRFKLSYAGAIAAGFIVVVLIAIAFLAGSRTSGFSLQDDEYQPPVNGTATNPAMLAAVSNNNTAQPNPLPAVVAPADNTVPTVANPSIAKPETVTAEVKQADPAPAVVPVNFKRTVGLNYIVAQSYPSKETADKAAEYLCRNGVPATVVPDLPVWAFKGWFSVVSTESFDRVTRNANLDSRLKQIEQLGQKFAKTSKFNRFKPGVYKWRPEADGD